MTKFLHERAAIEELYCNKLKEWSIKWGRALEKSTEYNTGTDSDLIKVTPEAPNPTSNVSPISLWGPEPIVIELFRAP